MIYFKRKIKKCYAAGLMLIIISITSCKTEYPADVENALQLAADNRVELEKVLKHYKRPKDSLKLKSAYFLIANMVGEGFQYGRIIDDYNKIFDILAGKSEEWKKNQPWYAKTIDQMLDSLVKRYGAVTQNSLMYYTDLKVLDSKYLITNINQAVEAWQKPWSSHITFEQFCEYILPYRTFGERPEYWRNAYKNKYDYILDSVKNPNDVLEVGLHLNQAAMPYFSLGFDKFPVTIAPSNLLKGNFGNCSNNANHKILAFRSMGVPVALDFIPIYGNNRNKHFWNSTLDNEGNPVSFMEPLKDPNSEVIFLDKFTLTKIFRKTFAHQPDKIKLLREEGDNVPYNLRDTKYIDVTDEYIETEDVNIELSELSQGANYAYIGVFNNSGWYPVQFAQIEKGKVVFTKLGRNVVYLPMAMKNKQLIAAANPFLLNKNGEVEEFSTKNSMEQKVKLTRKYNINKRKENWQLCLVNGEFQGANAPDFSDAVVLHTIKNKPGQHLETVNLKNASSFRYLRFKWNVDTTVVTGEFDGDCIAELRFLDKNNKPLRGTPIALPGQSIEIYPPEKVFDGNPLTYYIDTRDSVNTYIGLDLGAGNENTVSSIQFQARNDLNCIQPGDKYELLYWHKDGFKSLGQQMATDTVLVYSAPKGALFWLRNLSGGSEERIFTYENGMQIWW
jgi:hypothetical protein